MVKLIALYKMPQDAAAFDDNYFNSHIPLAMKMPGLKKAEVSRVTGSPMPSNDFYMMAELYFEDQAAIDSAMASPEAAICTPASS